MTEAEKRYRVSPKGRAAQKQSREKHNRTPKRIADMKIARRKWRLANPENERLTRQRAHHKIKYGESYDEKLQRIEKQGRRCANPGCRTTDPGPQGWHTDHDHVTGKVRGELCGGCNKALGFIHDDEFKAEGLAVYVRQHKCAI